MPGWTCPECVITVSASWPGEADLLALLHDQLIHNQRETALVGASA